MYGLNMFALLMFAAINRFASTLAKTKPAARDKTLRVLCILLLAFNLVSYGLPPVLGQGVKLPVEFSSLAYFAVPAILLSGRKKLQSWAAYSGLMAGFFYYLTMIAAGGSIYNAYPPPEVYGSLGCHGILYLCGLVTIRTCEFERKDSCRLFAGVGYVALQAHLLRPLGGAGRLFIYELMDGVYVKQLLPPAIWGTALPVYYIAAVLLAILSIRAFFSLNHAQCRKYANVPAQVPYADPQNFTLKRV